MNYTKWFKRIWRETKGRGGHVPSFKRWMRMAATGYAFIGRHRGCDAARLWCGRKGMVIEP